MIANDRCILEDQRAELKKNIEHPTKLYEQRQIPLYETFEKKEEKTKEQINTPTSEK